MVETRQGTPDPDGAAAVLEGACVRFGTVEALHGITLTVPRGIHATVIGPNGSGKSTLLGLLSGLVRAEVGRVEVLDGVPGRSGGRVAHVLQSTAIREEVPMTVRETVRLGTYARLGILRPAGRATRQAVDEALERLRIADLANRPLHELSGGQRQRAFIAQGLVQDADLLLLDEPVNGLDVPSQEVITQVMADEVARGRTVIVSTHDIGAAAGSDMVVLVATRLIAAGAPSSVLTSERLLAAYGRQLAGVLDPATLGSASLGSATLSSEVLP